MTLKDLLDLLDPYTTLRLVYDDVRDDYISTKELLDEDFGPGSFLDRTVIKIDPEGGPADTMLMVKLNEAGK